MYFIAWNGEMWSSPFKPCDLIENKAGGLMDRYGVSITWDEDGFRGENWVKLENCTHEKMSAIIKRSLNEMAINRPIE